MELKRAAGILLPISCLPGDFGFGDLGAGAYQFVDWLHAAGQSWWQMLPLGPTQENNSPYEALSSWAGSPLYISLEGLVEGGDLSAADLKPYRRPESNRIYYRALRAGRRKLLALAARNFFAQAGQRERAKFAAFCRAERGWLEDWARFAALRRRFNNARWWDWPASLAQRNPEALKNMRRELAVLLGEEKYIQYRFYQQWGALRAHARRQGVGLIGDVPIYCGGDSADVWAAQDLFKLERCGRPAKMAGVPPDYFSRTGQLWGMPVYDWPKHKRQNFRWWVGRLRGVLKTVDWVRIDHFRGLEAYWEVPGRAKTAMNGRWVKGPGHDFFAAVRRALGDAPFIAEDLGSITPKVLELRHRWGLPGMRVLQFAFGGNPRNSHLPFWHQPHSVAYTGTHDNDTAIGWYRSLSPEVRANFQRYAGSLSGGPNWALMRLCYASPASLAVVPMQDVLGLDSSARLNTPGCPDKIYLWKLRRAQLRAKDAQRLRELAGAYARAE